MKEITTSEFIKKAKALLESKYTYGEILNERKTRKITRTEFINRAILKHQNNFNYDKVHYVNSNTKVIVTCKIHGDFEQFPRDHLNGCGCSDCSGKKKKTSQKFIEEANKIHNFKFNYDKVDAHNRGSKINN